MKIFSLDIKKLIQKIRKEFKDDNLNFVFLAKDIDNSENLQFAFFAKDNMNFLDDWIKSYQEKISNENLMINIIAIRFLRNFSNSNNKNEAKALRELYYFLCLKNRVIAFTQKETRSLVYENIIRADSYGSSQKFLQNGGLCE